MTSAIASRSPAGDSVMAPEIGRVRFAAGKTIWLWGMTIPGLILGIPAMTSTMLAVSVGLAFVTLCIGHSVGLHRGVIHRNYHAFPGSARMGMRLRELDLSWVVIRALERLRLVHDVVAWHRAADK
jgi:fatty-acid desaturase